MNRTWIGGVVAFGALMHACSGGEQGRHEPAARVQSRAISGPPALSAPIALDTGTVDWSWSQQSAYLLTAFSDLDEHLLVYSVGSLAGSRILGVPIRDGEADAAFVLARQGGSPFHVTRMPAAWLSVYSAGPSSWSVVATETGELTDPVLLPLTCSAAGVAWGTDLALVTDSCGNGLMLDADGEPVGDPFIINGVSDDYPYYCYYYGDDDDCLPIYGGNVAFNGEYFLTTYGWLAPYFNQAQAFFYSFSADGTFTGAGSAGVATFYDEEAAYPFGLVSNGSSFLQLIEVGRSSYLYRSNYAFVVSVTDGTVSVDDARAVGTGVACDSFEPSDQAAYALALADDYGFVRRDADGESTGLKFSELGDCYSYGYPVVLDVFPTPVATSTAAEVLLAQGTAWFRYDSDFVPLDAEPHTAQLQAPLHSAPAAVHTPVGYFAGWLERTTDPTRSLGRHVTELGAIVEDEPIALRTAASGADKLVFASDGARALTVLANQAGTQIDLVDDAGVVTAVPSTIEAAPTVAGSHSAAADADGFLLAWLASGGYQAMKIDSEGSAGTPFSIGPVAVDSSATASAYDGANDVVVWTGEASTTTRTLYGVRIDLTGALLDDPPVPILTYSSDAPAALGSNVGPSLTRTSDGLVVAWTEHDGTAATFRAQRLGEDLTLVGAAVDVAEVEQANPAAASSSIGAAWDGESVWFVGLSATTTPFATVWGRRLTATLEAGDEEPFIIDEDAYSGTPAALTPGPDGQLLVAYGNPTLDTVELHIEGRLLSSLGFADGTPCSEDSVCASGACEAGACGPEGSGTGGSTADGSGGSTADGSGGSTADGSGGSTTTGGSGGSTAGGIGGSTMDGIGGSTAGGSGGSTTTGGSGGSTADGIGGSTMDGIGGSTADGIGGSTADGIGGSGPSDGGSAGSTGSPMGSSTAVATSHGGAASGGSHAGSSGSAGEGAQGGSSPTGGGSEATNNSIGGSGATTGGGGHDDGDCSCSAPGRASHTNLASLVMLALVAVGRRRPKTPIRC